jgi:ribosomal protein S18 acetylase RimI-like enzyme
VVLDPASFLVVATEGTEVVGFVAGTAQVGALYRSFLRHEGFRAAVGSAGRLVGGWRRTLETLRHGRGGDGGRGEGFELLAIAVDPTDQGSGIGRALVDAFLGQVRAAPCDAAYVVVAESNARAVSLYRRSGFVRREAFELHAGTTSLVMQWTAATGDTVAGHER